MTKGWHRDEQRWFERFHDDLAADYGEVVKKALLFRAKARGECWKCVLTRTESEWAKGLSWKSGFHEAVEREGITLL